MIKKTLFISDLDGTLLGSNEKLSDYTISVINELKDNGIMFSYATARSFVTAQKVTKELSMLLPVIVYNGTFIIDSLTKNILYANYFSFDEVHYIKNKLIELNISPITYSYIDGVERFSFVSEDGNIGKTMFLNSRTDFRRREVCLFEDLFLGNLFYFTCIGTYSELSRLEKCFKDDERFNCIFYKEAYTGEYFCELTRKDTSKANAIQILKDKFGFEKVVSFGDSYNDLPMFSISDECYAVGNACFELKAKATEIIKSNDEDGVAIWLKENACKYS